MNPFRLGGRIPRRPGLRITLGILGAAMLWVAAERVDWHQLGSICLAVNPAWLLASILVGALAMTARALRLTGILGPRTRFGGVWRAIALGYLGRSLLPMGGGEFLKIGALRIFLDVPTAAAAAGAILDRFFDLLGLAVLLTGLISAGMVLQVRHGMGKVVALGLPVAGLAVVVGWWFWRHSRSSLPGGLSFLGRTVDQVVKVLKPMGQPALLGRLLSIQAGILVLDVVSTWWGLKAFPFGLALPLPVSIKLAAYMMLGGALPLLPGGVGTTQIACLLALVPAGVSSTGAFAFSLLAQGVAFAFQCLVGVAAAWWPGIQGPGSRRSGGTA
jgi:hypothetical protein